MDEWRAVAIDTLAGWAAGVVCTVAFQPVDTVLTRQQYEVRAAGAASVVLRQGGLWRGTAPLLALVPLQNALLMVGYGAGERWGRGLGSAAAEPPAPARELARAAWRARRASRSRRRREARLEASRGADDATVPVVAGAWAATVAWVVGYPFDLLKTLDPGLGFHLAR
ncbi:mitochondrial carrier protein [Aureococcus anophagefferens]|uniref:Mitochondrial carrier protein n=1 Tax=Aureococcus anophagefferens TaxID=44056 RepID=A0ABR1FTT3_AURAN